MPFDAAVSCPNCRRGTVPGDQFCTSCGWSFAPRRPIVADGAGHAAVHGGVIADRYRLIGEGARGATSTVYLACDMPTSRFVAVKLLHSDPALRRRFAREQEVVRALSHPNILPQIDAWETDDTAFAVMPWVEGASLRDLLTTYGALTPPEIVFIVGYVSDALANAHAAGIVHRDVKPANILLDSTGWPWLCDFGVAKHTDSPDLTRTGAAPGSPAYMSPEQMHGDATASSDQYSLGVVAFELLSGARPFTGSLLKVQLAHLNAAPPTLVPGDDPLAQRLAALIVRMMAKSPESRWPDLATLRAELDRGDVDLVAARTQLSTRVARLRRQQALRDLMRDLLRDLMRDVPNDLPNELPPQSVRATPKSSRSITVKRAFPTPPPAPVSTPLSNPASSRAPVVIKRPTPQLPPESLAETVAPYVAATATPMTPPPFAQPVRTVAPRRGRQLVVGVGVGIVLVSILWMLQSRMSAASGEESGAAPAQNDGTTRDTMSSEGRGAATR